MSNSKKILKVIITLIISFFAIITAICSAYAAYNIGDKIIVNSKNLHDLSKEFYCTDVNGHVYQSMGDIEYVVKGYIDIEGDTGWLNGNKDEKISNPLYAEMAYILSAENYKYGYEGFSKDAGIRQKSVWSIWNNFVALNTSYSEIKNSGKTHSLHPSKWPQRSEEDSNTTNALITAAENYAEDLKKSKSTVSLDITKAIRSSSGYIQCSVNFNATLSSIDVEYNTRDANGNITNSTYSIESDKNSDMFKLYAKDKTTPISLDQVKSGEIFYIYCSDIDAQITKLTVNVKGQSKLYIAKIYFLNAGGEKQRLIKVEHGEKTEDNSASCEIPVEDNNKVNLTIKKAGGIKDDSGNVVEKKSKLEGVTFNLKLLGNGPYVGIDNQGFVEYYGEPKPLTTDENGEIKIYGLKPGNYLLTEISIGENGEYKSRIIKAEITTNNGTVTISNSTNLSLGLNTNFTDVNLYIVDETNTGSMKIIKKGPSLKDNEKLVNLPETTVLLYRVKDSRFNGEKSGFVNEVKDNLPNYTNDWTKATQYITNSKGQVQIDRLYVGTYRIYEIKSSDDVYYHLEDQDGYRADEISAQNNWVYLGDIEVKEENIEKNPAIAPELGYFENQKTPIGSMKIIKKGPSLEDDEELVNLPETTVLLYRVKDSRFNGEKAGFVNEVKDGLPNYTNDWTKATQYITDSKGEVQIDRLYLGTYRIYEIKSSDDVYYHLEDQDGYRADEISAQNNWVYLGDIEVKEENIEKNPAIAPELGYFENQKTPIGSMKIIKKGPSVEDDKKLVNLPETTVVLYRMKDSRFNGEKAGFVTEVKDGLPNYANDWTKATQYITDSNGEVQINRLYVGTYRIYEIKSSDDINYNLEDQDKYRADEISAANNWVYLGDIEVKEENTEKNPAIAPELGYFENQKTATGSMKIIKKGPSLEDYTKLDNLPETTVVLYRMQDTRYKGGKVGFVSEVKDSLPKYINDWTKATQYITDSNGEVQIDRLHFGTYRIYEIKSSDDEFYNLEEQDRYRTDEISAANNWVYLGNIEVTEENTEDKPALAPELGYFENQRSVGDLKLIKKDSVKDEVSLAGAKFKLYSITEKAWVTFNGTKCEYNKNSTADQAMEVTTGEDGTVTIQNLHFADYKIYETAAPTGYDITKQIGYGADPEHPNWVLIKDPNNTNKDLTITISKDQGRDAPYEVTIKNKKVIAALEGFVWKDLSNLKNTTTDEVYTEGSYDELLGGIPVELYNGNNQKIATTVTDSTDGTNKGHYRFTKKDSGEEIYYWDLANGYVKFIYNDKEYITVTPFVGTDVKVNSKAQEENVKLDDNQLTGRGEAVTYRTSSEWDAKTILENNKKIANKIYGSDTQNPPTSSDLKETPITGYYDERDFIVKYINLGLVDVVDPTYEVSEELAYIKAKLNGYTYTYVYGEATDINSKYVPRVNIQNTKDSYNRYAIYPSDIAYSMKDSWNNAGKLQVYVVYKISVTNTTTLNIPKVYREEKLFLNSLTNLYDTNRYDLCNNENNEDSTDFALWSNLGNGTANYSVNDNNSVYKNGIIGGNTINSYIQFKVKEPALERILSGESIKNGEDDKEASKVDSKAYHDYLRIDNVWNEDQNALQTAVNKGYITAEEAAQNKFYTHKSVIKTDDDDALYLKMALGDERKLTGTVYEDTKSAESEKENLGNGIIDDNEQNRAKAVKVELVDSTGNPVYRYPDKNIAGTQEGVYTDQNGYYEIPGVEPGYYYLKYTYGDGTQKMVDSSGNEVDINLKDYKSTIVTSEATKNAMKKTAFENPNNEEIQSAINTLTDYYAGKITDDSYKSAQEMLEWYKSLGEVNYSVASDNIKERNKTNGFVYNEDGSIYNGETKVDDENGYILDESGNKMIIHSYTPMVGISIENDVENFGSSENSAENVHLNSYDRLNLGIIKEIPQDLKVEKKITNVKLTNQQGSTIVSSNPKQTLSRYLSDLDGNTVGGSKYARLEMDPNALYGSSLEATYEVTIMNNSYEDYIEDESSSNYGWYFKYGEKVDGAKLKETTVQEVIDELDSKYNYASLPEKVSETKVTNKGDIITTENKITLKQVENVTDVNNENSQVTMTGWDSMTTGESLTIDYLTTDLYGNELNDSTYVNNARITSLKTDNLTTLAREKAWGDDYHSSTTLIVMPSTGENRSNNYIIIAIVAILTLGIGIIFIKKKILK